MRIFVCNSTVVAVRALLVFVTWFTTTIQIMQHSQHILVILITLLFVTNLLCQVWGEDRGPLQMLSSGLTYFCVLCHFVMT